MKKKAKNKSTIKKGFVRLTFDAPKEFVERLKADAESQRVPNTFLLREMLILRYPPPATQEGVTDNVKSDQVPA